MTFPGGDGYGLGIQKGHLLREKLCWMMMECSLYDVTMARCVAPIFKAKAEAVSNPNWHCQMKICFNNC